MARHSLFNAFVVLILATARAVTSSRTLCIIKPDAFEQSEEIIDVIAAQEGMHILVNDEINLDDELVSELYAEHKEKHFFQELKSHMTSGPCVVMILEHPRAIATLRQLLGPTDPLAGSGLRTRFGKDVTRNALHASENLAAARWEIGIFSDDLSEGFDDDVTEEQAERMLHDARQAEQDWEYSADLYYEQGDEQPDGWGEGMEHADEGCDSDSCTHNHDDFEDHLDHHQPEEGAEYHAEYHDGFEDA